MNPETMTLADFFALAAKVGDAARVIREAQAMMGGAPVVRAPMLDEAGRIAPNIAPPAIQWTPAEMAERERLRAHREAATEAAVLEAQ